MGSFSDWCENKVFPAIARTTTNSVIVLDRAKYHTHLDDEDGRPTTTWNKQKLADAIIRWGGPPEEWPEKLHKKFLKKVFFKMHDICIHNQHIRYRKGRVHSKTKV